MIRSWTDCIRAICMSLAGVRLAARALRLVVCPAARTMATTPSSVGDEAEVLPKAKIYTRTGDEGGFLHVRFFTTLVPVVLACFLALNLVSFKEQQVYFLENEDQRMTWCLRPWVPLMN